MRVGTDAVLLGAWAEIKNSKNILDVGTGSGIIALMMAQRNAKAKITAIDIHPESVIEAGKNFNLSPWKRRLNAELISIQEFGKSSKARFDAIVSNPPFFSHSTPAKVKARHLARHTDSLSPFYFFSSCKNMLTQEGKLSVILPFYNSPVWIETAAKSGLFPERIVHVLPYPGKAIERILVEFSENKQPGIEGEFYIRKGKGLGYSEEYLEMTGDFYLPHPLPLS
jgi:tRNA1Val (adenine37-N6)-methyltransferase